MTQRGTLSALKHRVFTAQADAALALARVRAENELAATRARHDFQCGSYAGGFDKTVSLENHYVVQKYCWAAKGRLRPRQKNTVTRSVLVTLQLLGPHVLLRNVIVMLHCEQ